MTPTSPTRVTLSITSHTNVGKTTLVRTLLRRDVGKVMNQAHVTDENERFTWIETADGRQLHIWDTPGFGDSVRLLKLLQKQSNPIGWMVAHVWDRWKDRPLWCSQQAVKNVRDDADIVLYLVNALEDPEQARGYVDPELRVLAWMNKPVIVVLNQTGTESESEKRVQREEAWRRELERVDVVRSVVTLDSLARCWVVEGVLLEQMKQALSESLASSMDGFVEAWRAKHYAVFQSSMMRLAQVLRRAVTDEEGVAGSGQGRERFLTRAVEDLQQRLERDVHAAMQDLIEWHGLEGNAAVKIDTQLHDVTAPSMSSVMDDALNRAAVGGFGGAAAGTAAGAAIDAATGGMSLGLFALTGAFLGALGLAAWGKELTPEETVRVRWVPEFLHTHTQDLLMRYMAVAHFGRGQGDFHETQEVPRLWCEEIRRTYDEYQDEFQQIWTRPIDLSIPRDIQTVEEDLAALLETVMRRVLLAYYPSAAQYLS